MSMSSQQQEQHQPPHWSQGSFNPNTGSQMHPSYGLLHLQSRQQFASSPGNPPPPYSYPSSQLPPHMQGGPRGPPEGSGDMRYMYPPPPHPPHAQGGRTSSPHVPPHHSQPYYHPHYPPPHYHPAAATAAAARPGASPPPYESQLVHSAVGRVSGAASTLAGAPNIKGPEGSTQESGAAAAAGATENEEKTSGRGPQRATGSQFAPPYHYPIQSITYRPMPASPTRSCSEPTHSEGAGAPGRQTSGPTDETKQNTDKKA
jgi:hypothetical protein